VSYQLIIANRNYSSWSLRPWVLMSVLGIDFAERFQQTLRSDNYDIYRQHSPSGKLPCLLDGSTCVWDSLAIVLYLAERHRGVWPADPAARAWAYSAVAEMHSWFNSFRAACPFCVSARVELTSMAPAVKREFDRMDQLWCEGLSRFGGPFLAGAEFTAADAFYVPTAFRVRTYDLPVSSHALQWVKRMLGLPAVHAWELAAHADPWREPEHEKEIQACGRIVKDLRDG
jgi:glutathione S-transferase